MDLHSTQPPNPLQHTGGGQGAFAQVDGATSSGGLIPNPAALQEGRQRHKELPPAPEATGMEKHFYPQPSKAQTPPGLGRKTAPGAAFR